MKRRVRAFVIGLAFIMQAMKPAVGHTAQGNNPDLGRWAPLLKRFENPLFSSVPVSSGVMAWKAAIDRMKGLPAKEKIEKVNNLLNAVPYVDDQKRFGYHGYWAATPERFFREGGDCKDYALAKYASLKALGFSPEQLRIMFVFDKIKNVAHAILIVNNTYVLDNQNRDIELVTEIDQYEPLFSLNNGGWRREVG
jgi:predicted transglutaminase-like cysteine proteinase